MLDVLHTLFAENTPNASKHFSPICLPKPKSLKFLKKSSLWVSLVRALLCQESRWHKAPSDLQPHYVNGVFGNVYLLALDNSKR
jgi:hypothetical protein